MGKGSSGAKSGANINFAIPDMPELSGSVKQISWAENIRSNAIAGANDALREADAADRGASTRLSYPTTESVIEARNEFLSVLRQQTSAAGWIDNRARFGRNHVESLIINRATAIDNQKNKRRR